MLAVSVRVHARTHICVCVCVGGRMLVCAWMSVYGGLWCCVVVTGSEYVGVSEEIMGV